MDRRIPDFQARPRPPFEQAVVLAYFEYAWRERRMAPRTVLRHVPAVENFLTFLGPRVPDHLAVRD